MSLRKKLVIFVIISNILTIAALYAVTTIILQRDFTSLELQTVARNTKRAENALDSTITQIKILCADYAGWDDTYAFMKDRNQKYIDINFVDETFTGTKLDLVLIIDKNGTNVYSKAFDFHNKKIEELPKEVAKLTSLNAKVIAKNDPTEGVSGIILLDKIPWLISAYPIVTSEKQGPVAGTFIMGRKLDADQAEELKNIVNLDVKFETPEEEYTKLKVGEVHTSELNREKNQGLLLVNDIHGGPGLVIRTTADREVTAQLSHGVVYVLTALIIVGSTILIIGLGFTNAILINPLSRLVIDVRRITRTKKFSLRVHATGDDEIASLAKDINGMLVSLEQTSKSLVDANDLLKKQRDTVELEVDNRTHQLKEEQARLIASINSFPDAYVITDMEGNLLLKNNALNKTLDVTTDMGSIDQVAKVLEGVLDLKRNISLALKERKSMVLSGLAYNKKFLKIYVAPIVLRQEEQSIGTLIIIADITESVLTERSKDEFLSIASHELRTPLSAIRGNSELLKTYYAQKVNDKSFEEIVDDIKKGSISLIEIVNTFLKTSRLEQGRIEFKEELIPISQVVNEVVAHYRKVAEEKAIQLKVSIIAPDSMQVIADKERLIEILTNLIGNSIKYTDHGSITIVVDKSQEYAKVSVIDTGKGIPNKQQSMLFKKFQQASNNIYTRDITKGTGLGLYISKLMVESMGGEIYLEESIENKGSIFSFTLPCQIIK